MKTSIVLKKIFLFPIAVAHSILLIHIGVFLLLPLMSAIFCVYKWIVTLIAKCVKREFLGMLPLQDSMMAHSNFHKHVQLYQSGQWHFEGKLNLEDFIELFDERVVKKTLPNGNPKFPEVQCSIEPFMGYFFRKKDEKFDLRNHIQEYQPESSNAVVHRKKLDQIVHEYTNKLYPLKRSPWGVLIVNNCRLDEEDGKEYSVVIGKNHHCIGDAYAVLVLFWGALFLQDLTTVGRVKATVEKPNKLKLVTSFFAAARDCYLTGLKIGFDIIFDRPRLFDENEWHCPKKSSEHIHTTLPPIQTSLVKEICAACNVSITAVLTTIVTGGLRRMMAANGLKSPKNSRISFSLPLKNHPDRLTNYSSVTFFDVNHSCPDQKKRLQMNDENLNVAARWSLFGLPFASLFLAPLPIAWNWYTPEVQYNFSSTTFMANAPVPTPASGEVEFLGCRIVRAYGTCEQSPNKMNNATVVGIMKYKDGFFTNYAIQRHLLTNEDQIYEIEKYMLEELAYLRKAILEPGDELSKLRNAAACENGYDNVTYL